MRTIIKFVGLGWALIGFADLIHVIPTTPEGPMKDAAVGFAVVFCFFIFILPGLGLSALTLKKG